MQFDGRLACFALNYRIFVWFAYRFGIRLVGSVYVQVGKSEGRKGDIDKVTDDVFGIKIVGIKDVLCFQWSVCIGSSDPTDPTKGRRSLTYWHLHEEKP